MKATTYEDLYDAERRPGAGVELWTKGVERQLARVREVNYRHRLHHSPNEEEHRDDPDAEWELHVDVYFLALAIRRVLLFHDLFSRQTSDPRLKEIRQRFDESAAGAKPLRDFLEHLDEYLLDSERKRLEFPGRASPVLRCTWQADNVIVCFGPWEVDITLAAVAAVELGNATSKLWEEHLQAALADSASTRPPDTDEGAPRMLEVTVGRSTVIGGVDDPPEISTGTLLGVRVRPATEQELSSGEPTTSAEG